MSGAGVRCFKMAFLTATSKADIERLIDEGENMNFIEEHGYTALHFMVQNNKLDCVVALLSHGCEVDLRDIFGETPLHAAARAENIPILQALIVFGADVNCRNKFGISARHILAVNGKTDNSKKALYILHAVGAARCTLSSNNPCAAGCSPNFNYNGIEPPLPHCNSIRSILTLYTPSSLREPARGGRVLCLDGGGIRGLVLILILLYLEEHLKQPIIHCFDWISGTSTGAIFALALASGKTVKECLYLYFRLKEKAFIGDRPYPSEHLESFLIDAFGNAVMSDIKHPKIMVMGLIADHIPAKLHLFRNYPSPSDMAFSESNLDPQQETNEKIWKAARASGAAPTYFSMFHNYVDGGLMANNPTMDTLTEIDEYNMALRFVKRESEVKDPTVVVSIGTGMAPNCNIGKLDACFRISNPLSSLIHMKNLLNLLVDQATQADGRVVDRARSWCRMIKVPYFRFSPQLSKNIGTDEKDDVKLINMLWETKVYIIRNNEEILRLVEMLKS